MRIPDNGIEIKQRLRKYGLEFRVMPSISVINQLLKYSEIDKQHAIEHLTNLFKEANLGDFFSHDLCKRFVEGYLKNPYLTDELLKKEGGF